MVFPFRSDGGRIGWPVNEVGIVSTAQTDESKIAGLRQSSQKPAPTPILTFAEASIELPFTFKNEAGRAMKISLEWLEQDLPGAARDVGAARAADALMNGGLPVETVERVGDDTVIDVEVTSNRADCLSHVGVARELGALLNRASKVVEPVVTEV